MLSLLIPTYNCDCLRLVADLHQQCEELEAEEADFDYEILVADDASTDLATVERNELMEMFDKVRFVRMTENVGRAALRNWLLDEACFPHLLLMDADAEVCSDDFLRTYWAHRHDADAVVGSIHTPSSAPVGHELRLKYELAAAKIRDADYRNAHAAQHFSTFNFLIAREVAEQLRFDLRCRDYGYEDTLFGLELAERGFTIRHIDNPLTHTGINSNADFLRNTETALRNLARLGSPLTDHSAVARIYARLRGFGLSPLVRLCFGLAAPLLRRQLLSRRPSLRLFQLYKLGYFAAVCAPR